MYEDERAREKVKKTVSACWHRTDLLKQKVALSVILTLALQTWTH